MFSTAILDVAVGMIFIYLLLSLLCSATNELIELLLKKRATDLERGIRELLEPETDSGTAGLVKELYDHPLVNGLFEGTYEKSGIASGVRYLKGTKLPSYIPSRNFALALMDLVAPATGTAITSPPTTPGGVAQLAALRDGLKDFAVKYPKAKKSVTALTALIDSAGDDVTRARLNIEDWFNSSMDRVSGWYKRRSHTVILILGLLVAFAVNADSVLIVRKLAADRALRESMVAAAESYAAEHAKAGTSGGASVTTPCASAVNTTDQTPEWKLKRAQCQLESLGLPIGWGSQTDPRLSWYKSNWSSRLGDHLFGWLLTALAISLGAPFWFDLLNKFIVIRSTVKPKEKSREEKSKD